MFTKLRNRIESEQGFTLIELLVVILIIGILAAIAIPSFLNQRQKGQDACAKSMVRTVQTAMETYYTDYNTYSSATITSLNAVENQIPTGAACGTVANLITIGAAQASGSGCSGTVAFNNYCIGLNSAAQDRPFVLNRSAAGVITRFCGTSAGGTGNAVNGGGCPSGTW
jgi:type IV pilus assembly protein PilA